jgi:hypothetical protein
LARDRPGPAGRPAPVARVGIRFSSAGQEQIGLYRLSGWTSRCTLWAVTIRWFTDADQAEQARIVRERLERDALLIEFARWLTDRAGHDGPVTVPELTPETESHLIRLLRDGMAPPAH